MKDISQKTKEELTKNLTEQEEALRNFRFGIAGSKIRNVREGRNIRRQIARIKTALRRV